MTIATLLAAVIVAGPWVRLGQPRPAADVGDYFEAVLVELRRGASLRHAIAMVAPEARHARLARSGQPIAEVAASLDAFVGGRVGLIVPGLALAARTGAPAAPLFAALVQRARRDRARTRLRRTVTAQAQLSAAVVAALPMGLGVLLAVTRRTHLLGSGMGRMAIIIGLLMQLAGVAVIVILLRRVR